MVLCNKNINLAYKLVNTNLFGIIFGGNENIWSTDLKDEPTMNKNGYNVIIAPMTSKIYIIILKNIIFNLHQRV